MQRLELPHNHKGEVDWNTLGNILSANLLGEVLCASYIDHKYGKQETFQADTAWEFAYEERNVVVLRKRLEDSPISVFMGRGVIDRPMDDVVLFVGNIPSRKLWDSLLVEIKTVKRLSNTDVLVYMRHQANRCLVKQEREFLYYERMTYIDGKYVQTAMSVDHPDYPPTNITRAQIRPGTGWIVEPYEEDKTLITYCAHVDLRGLPPIIMNRVLRRQPMAIRYIRTILMDPKKRRNFEESCTSTMMFTASDQHAVEQYVRSSGDGEEQNQMHSADQQYEERVSLDAFTVTSRRPSPPVWRSETKVVVPQGVQKKGIIEDSQEEEVNEDDGQTPQNCDVTEPPLPVVNEPTIDIKMVAIESNHSGLENDGPPSIDTSAADVEAHSEDSLLLAGENRLLRSSPILTSKPYSQLQKLTGDEENGTDSNDGAFCTGSACFIRIPTNSSVPVSSDLEASCQTAFSDATPDQCCSLPTLTLASARSRNKADSMLTKAHSTEALNADAIGNFKQTAVDCNSDSSSQDSFHTASAEVGPKDCCDGGAPRNGFQATSDSAASNRANKDGIHSATDKQEAKGTEFTRERLGTDVFDITVSL